MLQEDLSAHKAAEEKFIGLCPRRRWRFWNMRRCPASCYSRLRVLSALTKKNQNRITVALEIGGKFAVDADESAMERAYVPLGHMDDIDGAGGDPPDASFETVHQCRRGRR